MNQPLPQPSAGLLICEELFMLLRRDDGKPVSMGLSLGLGMSGAVVADLRQAGRVELVGDKTLRVVVVDPTPTGHPVLDPALQRVGDKNLRRLESTVSDTKLDPTKAVVAQLVAYGLLVSHPHLIGTRHEVAGPLAEWRQRLATAIVDAPTSGRDAILLGLINALDAAKAVFPETHRQLGRREFGRRLKAITASVPEAKAVEQAQMAYFSAVVAATS